jgi:hypothetical protein
VNKLNRFLELVYDVLFHPSIALRVIAAERKVDYSFGAFLISLLIPVGGMYFGLQATFISGAVGFFALIEIIGSFLFWIVGASVLALIAEFFGGRGTVMGLLDATGFAHLPRVFFVPLSVLAFALPNGIRTLFLGLSGIIIVFWTLALYVIAIREAYELSSVRAIMVLITPWLAMLAVGIMAFVFAGSVLLQWLPRM